MSALTEPYRGLLDGDGEVAGALEPASAGERAAPVHSLVESPGILIRALPAGRVATDYGRAFGGLWCSAYRDGVMSP